MPSSTRSSNARLVAAGMIQELRVADGCVAFTLELTTPACPLRDTLRQAAEEAVRALPGVAEVKINLTARVRAGRGGEELLRDVRNVIAVASGKGGVGKSTIAPTWRWLWRNPARRPACSTWTSTDPAFRSSSIYTSNLNSTRRRRRSSRSSGTAYG